MRLATPAKMPVVLEPESTTSSTVTHRRGPICAMTRARNSRRAASNLRSSRPNREHPPPPGGAHEAEVQVLPIPEALLKFLRVIADGDKTLVKNSDPAADMPVDDIGVVHRPIGVSREGAKRIEHFGRDVPFVGHCGSIGRRHNIPFVGPIGGRA